MYIRVYINGTCIVHRSLLLRFSYTYVVDGDSLMVVNEITCSTVVTSSLGVVTARVAVVTTVDSSVTVSAGRVIVVVSLAVLVTMTGLGSLTTLTHVTSAAYLVSVGRGFGPMSGQIGSGSSLGLHLP